MQILRCICTENVVDYEKALRSIEVTLKETEDQLDHSCVFRKDPTPEFEFML
jgi:hypothetical protein